MVSSSQASLVLVEVLYYINDFQVSHPPESFLSRFRHGSMRFFSNVLYNNGYRIVRQE